MRRCRQFAAVVESTTADGAVHRLSQSAARGSDLNPMSDRDLQEKLRASTLWNPKADVTPLIDAIWGLDQCADVARLARGTESRVSRYSANRDAPKSPR
jgi:hypothetical protein